LLVTVAVYPILRTDRGVVMFSFPELTFCVMGMLVWIGGYTGYDCSTWCASAPSRSQ